MKNPIRRSKKIGKTQGGRVKDGRAEEKWSRLFPGNQWFQISDRERNWQFFVENPSRDYYHPCKPKEYLEVLKRLPSHQTEYVQGIILRRTPKIDLKLGITARQRFSCVILNSFPKDNKWVFEKKPSKATIKHYEPFCSNWTEEKGAWVLNWDDTGVRRFYLFHLFLHEIGHINEGYTTSRTKREKYADSFARDMAEWLDEV